MATRTDNLSTRGTNKVRRRAQQAQAKVDAETEIAKLVSPDTPEKQQKIADAKAADVRKHGTTAKTRRETKQADNKAAAQQEIVDIGTVTVQSPIAELRPGQQVDHQTARRFMKFAAGKRRDESRVAATAAGKAVLGVLRGREMGAGASQSRFRKIARQEAAQANLNAKQE